MAVHSGSDRESDQNLIAYEFLRDEIKREDGITFQRLSSALAFQAILMAAMALVATNGLPSVSSAAASEAVQMIERFYSLRVCLLLLIGAAGLAVSIGSLIGVHASMRSLRDIKTSWESKIDKGEIVPDARWPQAYGTEIAHRAGHLFPYAITASFIAIWIAYLAIIAAHFVRVAI